ncbi:L,D-transpeptidase family protein [Thermoproteota archaeon]
MRTRFIVIIVVVIILVMILGGRLIKNGPSNLNRKSASSLDRVSSQVGSYLKEAASFEEKGSLLEAKEIYLKLLEMDLESSEMELVQQKLEGLNIKILFSGVRIDESLLYEVKPRDSLFNIAKKFKTTVESITRANNIKGTIIHPGMKLRILNGTFSILVDKSSNILILKLDDEVVKTYDVSTGINNSTPVGTHIIKTRLKDPVWYKNGKAIPPTSPKNILGTRWLGFKKMSTYGIHGTVTPDQIGQQITDGCVRMRNEDVEELYDLIPAGVKVTIMD